MNSNELKAEIMRNNESSAMLAKVLNMTGATFSNKLNNKSEFTLCEIQKIKEHYNLSAERLTEIFFA